MTAHRNHHPTCPCGCDELADECAGTSPNPLGSLRITRNVSERPPIVNTPEDDA